MQKRDVLLLILFVPCAALVVLFGFDIFPIEDRTLALLLGETVPRLAAGVYLVLFLCMKGFGAPFCGKWRPLHLLWAVPCLAVAVVNFPFSALIGGEAAVDRADLLWLFLLKCLGVALLEETFFRALLVPLLRGEKGKDLFSVLLSAALFAAMHLLNLFSGNVGAVFLQVGYTFLLGCMFAVMLLYTGNVWLCIFVHFLFDVGGTLIPDLGHGSFQDTVFWILTAVVGVLCALHIILTFLALQKRKKNSENDVKADNIS